MVEVFTDAAERLSPSPPTPPAPSPIYSSPPFLGFGFGSWKIDEMHFAPFQKNSPAFSGSEAAYGPDSPVVMPHRVTSTVRCRPWRPQPRLRLILGIGGMVGSVAAQAPSSTARPGGGNTESACPTMYLSGVNRLVYAQTVFSALSIVVCLAVMAVLCKGVV